MTDLALFPELMPEEQFRAVRLQVHNWGTFSGCNDIPIAEEGFLFVGASGSGKSTLLDAFSQLLIPPRWVDFNAAAHETGGKVKVEVYPAGELGDQPALAEQVTLGALDSAVVSLGNLAMYSKKLNTMTAPFLFKDYDHAHRTIDAFVMPWMNEGLAQHDAVGLSMLQAWLKNPILAAKLDPDRPRRSRRPIKREKRESTQTKGNSLDNPSDQENTSE